MRPANCGLESWTVPKSPVLVGPEVDLERRAGEGESPVGACKPGSAGRGSGLIESGCLRLQPQSGGRLHPRLNTCASPIADKYREGKVKSTLKREFKRP